VDDEQEEAERTLSEELWEKVRARGDDAAAEGHGYGHRQPLEALLTTGSGTGSYSYPAAAEGQKRRMDKESGLGVVVPMEGG
jgi:hypothetical protein